MRRSALTFRARGDPYASKFKRTVPVGVLIWKGTCGRTAIDCAQGEAQASWRSPHWLRSVLARATSPAMAPCRTCSRRAPVPPSVRPACEGCARGSAPPKQFLRSRSEPGAIRRPESPATAMRSDASLAPGARERPKLANHDDRTEVASRAPWSNISAAEGLLGSIRAQWHRRHWLIERQRCRPALSS